MRDDTIETLLLRHYEQAAPVPTLLEQRLVSSVRDEMRVRHQQERIAANIRAYRINRRRAVKLVAISSVGLGLLGASLDVLEHALSGTDNIRQAH